MRNSSEESSTAQNTTTCDASATGDVLQEFPMTRSFLRTDILVILCTVSISALLIAIFVRKRRRRATNRSPHMVKARARKRDFIARVGSDYGYASSCCGHVDTWRLFEFPNLIAPLGDDDDDDDDERQVYLDYAGAALPTRTQLEKIMRSNQTTLANPHSFGPAASQTVLLMEQAKKRVLDHFDCHPGRFAGWNTPPHDCTLADVHPGYDIIWTSGATEALKIIAERFPWTVAPCVSCSTLVYTQNSHTSVIGMRGPAMAKGASFSCHSLLDVCNATVETLDHWDNTCNHACSCRENVCNLLVIPLECNFGGDTANVSRVFQNCRKASSQWYTLLDMAKAASTDAINLKDLDPDFACLSFYKLFGEPTGLGALLVKRSITNLLPSGPYFGGGSVDAVLPGIDFAVGRSTPPLASLANGTVHFRGIASLVHGFDQLDRLGGMTLIRKHTTTLATELARRLHGLRHGNGRPAIVLYGAWAKLNNETTTSLPGPTLAFNVLRDDGSFVGYNEVAKLAALNRPPIQLRTGCFCNPGACQEALDLTNEQVMENYQKANHVCGDHIDIINDKPTGAIRASFGKDSLWEDLDVVVLFLERNFVNTSVKHKSTPALTLSEVKISQLYIFPIKSCAAQRVSRWMLHETSGRLDFDREFALVDSSGTAMRLQTYPQMSSIQPKVDLKARTMTVSATGCNDLVILLDDPSRDTDADESIVQVCGNKCGARLWGDVESSEWFSSFLGVQCWLARHYEGRYEVTASAAHTASSLSHDLRVADVAFANEAPLLLLSEHSVDTLNQVLSSLGQRKVDSRHFRPNLVVQSQGASAEVKLATNPEDCWTKLCLEERGLDLVVTGDCARCSMVDVDPTTGLKGKTLRALADYRRKNGQIHFGVFLRAHINEHTTNELWLQEGDVLKCT